jgi:hypothetical protein
MENLAKTIVKDGLIALVFWVVVRVLMIWAWQYTGQVLSNGLGIILVVSFIGVTLRRVVDFFNRPTGPFPVQAGGFPPLEPTPPGTGRSGPTLCRRCNGERTMDCPPCNGRGQNLEGGEWKTCPACMGRRKVPCSGCQGAGVV